MTSVKVINPSVSCPTIVSEALIVPVTAGNKVCLGGLDSELQRNLHFLYEEVIAKSNSFEPVETHVVYNLDSLFGFKNCVFVIDYSDFPIRDVILKSLIEAEDSGFSSVDIPVIWDRNNSSFEAESHFITAGEVAWSPPIHEWRRTKTSLGYQSDSFK